MQKACFSVSVLQIPFLMIPEEEVWRLPNQVSQEREGSSGLDRGGNPLPKAVAGVGVCVCVLCVSQGLRRDETSLSRRGVCVCV